MFLLELHMQQIRVQKRGKPDAEIAKKKAIKSSYKRTSPDLDRKFE